MNSLHKRLISAVIGIPLLIYIVSKGGLYLSLSILLLSLIGLKEFYNALENIKMKPLKWIGYLGAVLTFSAYSYPLLPISDLLALLIVILLIHYVLSTTTNLIDIAVTILGMLYIPYLFFHIDYLEGTPYIWLIFIIAFGTDTFAFIVGNLFGKNKLAPALSPNKTIEGSVGGIVGSLVLTLAYAYYINLALTFSLVVMIISVSICSQLGDLTASKVKRETKIKDFGNIMPGHGGVLDRFDSILFTAPLVYYYLKFLII